PLPLPATLQALSFFVHIRATGWADELADASSTASCCPAPAAISNRLALFVENVHTEKYLLPAVKSVGVLWLCPVCPVRSSPALVSNEPPRPPTADSHLNYAFSIKLQTNLMTVLDVSLMHRQSRIDRSEHRHVCHHPIKVREIWKCRGQN